MRPPATVPKLTRDYHAALNRLKLQRVLTFAVVAEEASFSLAAERMHMSQSAVSVQVRQLEAYLGVPLFHRTTRSVRLTRAGEELYGVSRNTFGEVVEVAGALRDQAKLQQGIVTVAALPLYAHALLPSVMREFAQAHPRLDVRLLDVDPDESIELVRRGAADFALLDKTEGLDELDFRPLFVEDFVLIAGRGNPALRRRRTASIAEVALSHGFVLLHQGIHARTLVDQMFAALGIVPRILQECAKPGTLLALVANGFGLTLLPRSILATGDFSQLQVLDIPEFAGREVGIVTRRDRAEAPAVASFREHLEARVARDHEARRRAPSGSRQMSGTPTRR